MLRNESTTTLKISCNSSHPWLSRWDAVSSSKSLQYSNTGFSRISKTDDTGPRIQKYSIVPLCSQHHLITTLNALVHSLVGVSTLLGETSFNIVKIIPGNYGVSKVVLLCCSERMLIGLVKCVSIVGRVLQKISCIRKSRYVSENHLNLRFDFLI